MNIKVVKRNGQNEDLNYEKINKVLLWATENIKHVSASSIAMNAKLQLHDNISTEEIHKVLIQSASSLISESEPNYQYVASNLCNYLLRKEVFGSVENLPHLKYVIEKNINEGFYDSIILENYSDSELEKLNKLIKHNRDYNFTYAGIQQLIDKYLIKNRGNGKLYETPQYMFMLIAMTLFSDVEKSVRIDKIGSFYNDISLLKINLPTPVMSGVRTPSRTYSSCTLIDVDDTLDSIIGSNGAVMKYTASRAGIGLNFGRIRSVGDTIRGGEVVHTGVIPFLKYFESATKSTTQNGVRGGNSTTHFPFWHKEIEDILVLKNNKGATENRVRGMDYSIQFNRLFYKRVVENGKITLFSPGDLPSLYEAFFNDNDKFEELYVKFENNKNIKKKSIQARDLFNSFIQERIGTGRMYLFNTDHVNTHSSFLNTVYMSNLCVAPETNLLTDNGYIVIGEHENEFVNVWNGKEYSNVQIIKTGENQKLIKLDFSNGQTIECTEYHKFYIQKGYNRGTGKNKLEILEKRACELKKGDKIIKNVFPIIDVYQDEFVDAYTQGVFTGDGCSYKGKNHIDLYGEKHKLYPFLNGKFIGNFSEKENRQRLSINNTYIKYNVPLKYSIKSRLEWFAGLCDSDGVLCKNNKTEHLQVTSTHKDFLIDVQFLLQSLGVNSKITVMSEEGYKSLPNHKGGNSDYLYKKAYRILIGSDGLYNLQLLGFKTNRLLISNHKPDRNCEQFIKVLSVEDLGRVSDTYCVNEPKEHKVIFNGIITGNCQEITLPTVPIDSIIDDKGEIALCVLSAINLGELKSLDELEGICENILRGLDFIIEKQDYPIVASEKMLKRRSVGVGITNLAYYLAKNNLMYSSPETLPFMDELMEHIQFNLIKASVKLAKEYGKCEYFDKTKYSLGILPIDTYCKNVDKIVNRPLSLDWEWLRQEILTHGMRNSTLTAIMPCESSSVVSNSTNGIEPVRSLMTTKLSKQGTLKMVVPEISKLRNKYQLAYDINDNKHLINIQAIIQKYIDQAISSNHYYDSTKNNGEISVSQVSTDILYSYQMGLKTLYYANTNDGNSDNMMEDYEKNKEKSDDISCESGACSI
jgi:ribonucleoside-diphosphate reductase alpha chain